MNAIIALCHFCELDGPNILFCTQPYHSSTLEHSARGTGVYGSDGRPMYFDGSGQSAQAAPPSPSACSDTGSTVSFIMPPAGGTHLAGNEQRRCLTCRVLGTELPGFVTNDHNAHITYVSTTFPIHPTLFTVVRKACVRSLSCEVLPGREGPAMYGDSKNGYVLSYTFIIKDCHARGFQRSYSLLFLMTDKNHLLNSFPFMVNQFRHVVEYLKSACQRTYDLDVKTRRPGPSGPQGAGLGMSHEMFRRRRSTAQLRSLMDLTQNKQLGVMLHRTFSWSLMTASTRVYEKQLEGPPIVSDNVALLPDEALHFELAATLLHLPPSFMPLLHRLGFVGQGAPLHLTPGATRTRSLSYARTASAAKPCAGPGAGDLANGIRGISLDALDGPPNPHSPPIIYTLPQLVGLLGPETFRIVCYHAIIGNQVIVRGASADTVMSVLAALAHLLPKSCAVVVPYADEYRDRWQCNLLGVRDDVAIPGYIDMSSYAVLDVRDTTPLAQCSENPHECAKSVTPADGPHVPSALLATGSIADQSTSSAVRFLPPADDATCCTGGSASPHDVQIVLSRSTAAGNSLHKAAAVRNRPSAKEGAGDADTNGHFDDFVMVDAQGERPGPATGANRGHEPGASRRSMLTTPTPSRENLENGRLPLQYKLPASARDMGLLKHMTRVLTGDEVSDSIKMQQLAALKEKWFNNAKVFFQFSRMHTNASDPSAISHFLRALGMSSSDLPALRFWTSGLTKEDRNRLLAERTLLKPRTHLT